MSVLTVTPDCSDHLEEEQRAKEQLQLRLDAMEQMERRMAQIKIAKHVRRRFARKAFSRIIQQAVRSRDADGHGLQACHSRIAVGLPHLCVMMGV